VKYQPTDSINMDDSLSAQDQPEQKNDQPKHNVWQRFFRSKTNVKTDAAATPKRHCSLLRCSVCLVVIALGMSLYYIWNEVTQLNTELNNQKVALTQYSDQQTTLKQHQQNILNDQLTRLQAQLAEVARVQQNLTQQSAAKNTSNVWWLLQGEMQLADLQSNTLNSPKSTQMLLSQMTNQIGTLLRATPDDKTAIHLQNELNLLQKNLSQLSTQKSNLAFIQILTLLQQNVMNLPLKVSMMQAPKSNAQPEAIVSHSSTTDHWLVWLEKSVTRVLSLISIRHVTTPITPLATIQDEMVLKDNIRLLLQQAKWMLVDKQAQPFEIIRQQIRQLLLEQFDVNDSGVKELLDQLQNMSMSNQPTLDFSNAMHLVGQGLEQSMQPKVTP